VIQEALARLVEGGSLSATEAELAMSEVMAGDCTPAQIGALLTALRMKGETAEEVAGFARAMRSGCIAVRTQHAEVVDTCGTGGDRCDTFNISTAAALVAAGAGIPIAKHGNRSVSSQCGSADVLRELGVNLELTPQQVGWCLDDVGIGFLFAPHLHPAMRHALGPRREMAIRTVFNVLGPLTNPAGARRQLLGVFAADWARRIAEALAALGTDRALVVHGLDGLDEISTTGPTLICLVEGGEVTESTVTPEAFGLPRVAVEGIAGGSPAECAAMLVRVLEGERGPRRDVVVLNAAAAIYVGGGAESIEAALPAAEQSIDSSQARLKLHRLVEVSQGA